MRVPVTPPRPLSQFSNGTEVYASGASRSPTPARPSSMYRRIYDEEQPPAAVDDALDDDDEEEDDEEDDDEELDEDIEDEDLVDAYLQPYAFRDSEKMSLSSSISSTLDGYPTSPQTTRHFGPAPAGRVHRRNNMMKFKKAVRLTNGNLVVDLDCPPKLIKVLPTLGGVRNEERGEMTRTRYTAVTGDPDDFARQGFFLRQNEMGRTTELFIVITMFNVRTGCSLSFSMCDASAMNAGAHDWRAGGRGAVLPDLVRRDAQHFAPVLPQKLENLGPGRVEEGKCRTGAR